MPWFEHDEDAALSVRGIQQNLRLIFDAVQAIQANQCEILAQFRALRHVVEEEMAALDDQITQLTAQVKSNTDAEDSGTIVINKIPQFITDAVNAALAKGATPAQLQALTDLATTLKAHADPLAAAIVANTPAAPPAP
jgi:hypothetical protein